MDDRWRDTYDQWKTTDPADKGDPPEDALMRERAETAVLCSFVCRQQAARLKFRLDVMEEKRLDGVSISKGFAAELVMALLNAADLLEPKSPSPPEDKLMPNDRGEQFAPIDDDPVF